MSSSSRRDIRLSASGSNDSGGAFPSHQRSTVDRLTLQSDAAADCHRDTPEVIELEAAFLDAARFQMAGATKTLAGDMDEGNFRAIWRGDRAPVTVREFCRMRLLAQPEAQRATDAAIAVLQSAGRAVATPVNFEAVARLVESASTVTAGLSRDLNTDNQVDAGEALRRLPDVRRAQAAFNALVAQLEQIAGGAR
jgi:hypothetical protein